MPLIDERPSVQGVFGMEGLAISPVGGGVGEDGSKGEVAISRYRADSRRETWAKGALLQSR